MKVLVVYKARGNLKAINVMRAGDVEVLVYPNGVNINSYGIPKRNYDFGDLTTPSWKYNSQITEGYMRAGAQAKVYQSPTKVRP